MQTNTIRHKENKLLDILKYLAAVLVLASHCLPIVSNDTINFFYGQWFFRFCVPFFIISSGYYFASFDRERKKKYIKRIALLYLAASLLYLPIYWRSSAKAIVVNLVFGCRHLWYLSALTIALGVCYALEYLPFTRKVFSKLYPWLAVILIIIGAYYDEYKHLFPSLQQVPLVQYMGVGIKYVGGSRHAIFFALPMLLIGRLIFHYKDRLPLKAPHCFFLVLASFGISLAECVMLRHFGGDSITCDITLFNYFPAVFLFLLSLTYQPKILEKVHTKHLRKSADALYIFHVLVLIFVDKLFALRYIPRLMLVFMITAIVSWLYLKIFEKSTTWFRK